VVPLARSQESMQRIRIQITGPGQGPGRPPGLVARILVSIVAVAALVVAAFLGAFIFLAALGFFLVASIVLAARIWWARRQIEKAMRDGRTSGGGAQGPGHYRERDRSDVIEGEYLVVDEESRREGGDDRKAGGGR
jgi:membrane protein implicated in regulation of membrane protease activity